MRLVLFTTLFAVLCAVCVQVIASERVVWINGESGVHADHPGKCWSASLNREFAVGAEFSDSDQCELVRCASNLRFQRRMY